MLLFPARKKGDLNGKPNCDQVHLSDLDSKYERLLAQWASEELFDSRSLNTRKLTNYGTIQELEKDGEKIIKESWINLWAKG